MLNDHNQNKYCHRFLTINGVRTSVWNWTIQIVQPDEVHFVEGDVEENGTLRALTDAEMESIPYDEIYDLAVDKSFWD